MHKPELLAPVGSKEALISAIENGADAVYFGGMRQNLRRLMIKLDLTHRVKSSGMKRSTNAGRIRSVLDGGRLTWEQVVPR